MSPVIFILLAAGADRLLSGGRPRMLEPVQARWLAIRPRLLAWLRSAPVTYGYLAILLVTSWVLASSGATLANKLLLSQSTNLHQLARNPVRVLIGSAFWVTGTAALLVWAVLFTAVLAPVERRIGSWRVAIVFGIGHVGATLLTAGGLWVALQTDAIEPRVVNARDVGASYGLLAVAAAMTYLLAPRLRRVYAAVLLSVFVVIAAISHTFTGVGHLISVLIGFGCYRLVHGHSAMPPIDIRPRAEVEAPTT